MNEFGNRGTNSVHDCIKQEELMKKERRTFCAANLPIRLQVQVMSNADILSAGLFLF